MQSLSTSFISLHSHVGSPDEKNKSKKLSDAKPSIIYFLALIYVFLCMGFGTGLIGPSLLKFSEQIKAPFDQVVYILFTRSFGYLTGTISAGILIDRFSSFGLSFLTFSIFVMCTTTIIIPFMYRLIPMIIIHFMWSFTAGIVDNLAQILTIRHYENGNVNPYLQAVHGAFGIGAFLSPLIIAPFLRKGSPVDQWHYAYWLIGCLHIPNLLWIFIYAIRNECCSKKTNELNLEDKEFIAINKELDDILASDEKPKEIENPRSKNYFILGLVTIFLLLYVGNETAYGYYIHTYASLHLHFPKDIAAYLNSAYWASFAFGRLCAVPLSIKLSPLQMICSDLIGCVSSVLLIAIFNKSSLILWIGSVLLGFSIASIYASAIAYTEKHMFITGKRMSILAIGGSTGDAVIPLIIGYSIDSKSIGPIGLIFVSLIVLILASLLFGFIVLYVRQQSKKKTNIEIENK